MLIDQLWITTEARLPKPKKKPHGPGRPVVNMKSVFEAILWILKTGARWRDLPKCFPSYQTCHRYFQRWVKSGAFHQLACAMERKAQRRGKLDVSEAYIDGTFAW